MEADIDRKGTAERLAVLERRLGLEPSAAKVAERLARVESAVAALQSEASVAIGERDALVEAIQLVSEGVVVSDGHGQVIYHNELAQDWLDTGPTGTPAREALVNVLQVAAAGRQNTRSLEVLGPPRRSLTVSGVPVFGADGSPVGAVAVLEDTTERRHAEIVRRDFVANVSHELKTPIGALGLLAETLMVEEDPEVQRRLIQRMHVETLRVAQVIDDLLNLSRIENLRRSVGEKVSAVSVIDQAIGRVRYTAEHRSIMINVDGDREATVYGGQRELVSAVHHLLENALKYSNEGSRVDVHVDGDGDWTEISVQDHGMGIAAQYLDRIFERFYRVDDARTRTTGGTGLGLSIVRHVVQNHGGEVRVTSQEGEGSTFTLRLASRPAAMTERLVVEGGSDG